MEFVGMMRERLASLVSAYVSERGRRRLFLIVVLAMASAILPALPAYAVGHNAPPYAVSWLVNK